MKNFLLTILCLSVYAQAQLPESMTATEAVLLNEIETKATHSLYVEKNLRLQANEYCFTLYHKFFFFKNEHRYAEK